MGAIDLRSLLLLLGIVLRLQGRGACCLSSNYHLWRRIRANGICHRLQRINYSVCRAKSTTISDVKKGKSAKNEEAVTAKSEDFSRFERFTRIR